ncbi:MAG: serine hydrolase domain-containing protein [Pseudomonadales bacterium]
MSRLADDGRKAIPTSTPGEQGIDARGILRFLDALEADPRIEPHGLIVQRHGRRVVEGYWRPHDRGRLRLLYSLSKTFTGTALGLLIGEGKLGLDDLASAHLPEAFATAHEGFRNLRIRHIASMASGHNRETLQEASGRDPDDVVRGFLTIPPDAEPGTLFAYNQPPVVALATILQRLAGERLVDYLRPRLFEPLGIDDVRAQQRRPGFDFGYTGVYASLDAVARLGQLYLDDGVWQGRRLLPAGWVAEASRVQTPNPQNVEPDWRQGYGLQLWMSRHGYRGDGAAGQYMVVLPEVDAVVALLSCTVNMQRVLDLMWQHLLPAMQDTPRRAPEHDDRTLQERLASLSLPTAQSRLGGRPPVLKQGRFSPVSPPAISHRTITAVVLQGNELLICEDDDRLRIPLSASWTQATQRPFAASASELPDGRIAIDLVPLATPHRLEITLNPATATFDARWPVMPLFGAGLGRRLTSMEAPPL